MAMTSCLKIVLLLTTAYTASGSLDSEEIQYAAQSLNGEHNNNNNLDNLLEQLEQHLSSGQLGLEKFTALSENLLEVAQHLKENTKISSMGGQPHLSLPSLGLKNSWPSSAKDPRDTFPGFQLGNPLLVLAFKVPWVLPKAMDAYPPELDGESQYDTNYTLTAECHRALGVYHRGILRMKDWAAWMLDADGVPASGLLDGSVHWLGNYEGCLRARATGDVMVIPGPGGDSYVHDFDAQYFRVYFRYPISNLSLSVGVCLPATCTTDDVTHMLAVGNGSIAVFYTYDGQRTPFSEDAGAIAVTVILAIFAVILTCATITDCYLSCKNQHAAQTTESNMNGTLQSHQPVTELSKTDTHDIDTLQNVEKAVENGTVINLHSIERKESDSTSSESYSNPVCTDTHEEANGVVVKGETPLRLRGTTQDVPEGESKEAFSYSVDGDETAGKTSCERHGKAMRSLLAFSLRRNVSMVWSASTPRGAYGSFNGIRFMSMMWLILGHAWALGLNIPVSMEHGVLSVAAENLFTQLGIQDRFSHMVVNAMSLAVDVFFVLRLTIPQAVVIMLFTTLFYYWGSGPLYPETFVQITFCKSTWWANLLYIHNFVAQEDMCLAWSWYLALDFQMFIIAPVFLYAMYRFPVYGSVFLFLGYSAALTSRIVLMHNDDEDVDSWADIYIMPWTRFGPYAMGMALGYIMYRTNCKVKLHKVAVLVGWLLAITLCLLAVYGSYDRGTCATCFDWRGSLAIAYYATARDVFALGITWVMFACVTGYGGVANSFLSWSAFTPLSRFCYLGYLIHPILIYHNYFSRQRAIYVEYLTITVEYSALMILTIAVAFVLSVSFETPFQELEKVLLPPVNKKKT